MRYKNPNTFSHPHIHHAVRTHYWQETQNRHCIELPQENCMFLQIIHEYPYSYLVKIDPVQDKSTYEDLLEFEKSKLTIQMNNYEPESFYILYTVNVCCPERHGFLHNISLRKPHEKSQHIILDRENLHKNQKSIWLVSYCSRWKCVHYFWMFVESSESSWVGVF